MKIKIRLWGALAGFCILLVLLGALAGGVLAAPMDQEGDPGGESVMDPAAECQSCHLDIADHWSHSPHAHAFDDPVYQERWQAMGEPSDCLVCHTTNFQQTSGSFSAEGVACAACHGLADGEHPPQVMSIQGDTQYCGTCHTTTLGEWRLTGHAAADVGCVDCHDPHSQDALFDVADDMCINCHSSDMGDYLEDTHVQKDIGCVDCHALVIPPDEAPDDGIVPTGHSFTITPGTCVACHTDSLHAGFSLPGYENGVSEVNSQDSSVELGERDESDQVAAQQLRVSPSEQIRSLEQQMQTLQASLANRNLTGLFQGGVIGLVLGGSTAWFVAQNVRRGSTQQKIGQEEDDEE